MSLLEALRGRLCGRVAVVGVGNPLCADDGVGCRVAELLAGHPGVLVFRADEVPESILGPVVGARPDTLVVVDAVDLGEEPGAVALLEAGQLTGYIPTTHRMPIGLFMSFVQREAGVRETFLLAIQPRRVGLGPMSPEIERSASLLAGLLVEAIVGGSGVEAVPCH